jgi:E3 ubiquitin-protein ligase HERC3
MSPVQRIAAAGSPAYQGSMRRVLSPSLALLLVPLAALLACESEETSGPSGPSLDGGFTFDGGPGSSSGDASPDSGSPGDSGGDGSGGFSTTFHVAIAAGAACAVFPDGRMKCWGRPFLTPSEVAVGTAPGEMGAALPFVALDKRVRRVRAGSAGPFCVVFEDGGVRCWGNGPLGQPTPAGVALSQITTNVDLGPGVRAIDVAIGGGGHVCAILEGGSVKCWGINSEGQLGLGDAIQRMTPPADPIALGAGRTVKALSIGYAFNCAILDDDRLKCWGRGNNTVTDTGQGGELGVGGTAHLGNDPNEMGDNLAYAKLGTNPGTGQPWKVKKVAAGRTHVCAILENDRVKCWGRNDGGGHLGSGNSLAYGATLVDDAIPFVDVGTSSATAQPWTVKDLGNGEYAMCALLANNAIRCWGQDAGFGTLGRGGNATIGDGAGEMGNLLVDVELTPGRTPLSLFAGPLAVCAHVAGSTLNCWGSNQQGVLGQGVPSSGPTSSRGDDAGELGANLAETLLE